MKDYIKEYCQNCIYYNTRCFYDYGDSLTKIPCEALRRIIKRDIENLQNLKGRERK